MMLAGDRNIYGYAPGSATLPAALPNPYGNAENSTCGMGTNFVAGAQTPEWTDAKTHQKNGNALLADGSVQQLSSPRLRDQLRNSGDQTQAGADFGANYPNRLMFP